MTSQSKWSSAVGLLAAAALLCVSRTCTSVFANLAAAVTRKHPECRALHSGKGGSGSAIPPAALVMLVEAAKFLISLTLWRLELRAAKAEADRLPGPKGPSGGVLDTPAPAPREPLLDRRYLLFAPLAALYCACNVLWLIALQRMAPPMYELLSTLRIPLSVLLAWGFAQSGALMRGHHYTALAMLVVANVLPHVQPAAGSVVVPAGAVLVLLSQASSTLANLFFELMCKERFAEVSIHLQNAQLYSWGVLLNGVAFAVMQHASGGDGGSGGGASLAWLPCVNLWHGCLIAAFACVGIVTGIVLKYHGNVASVVAQSFAVHLSALLSHLSISFRPTREFVLAAVLCQAAILLYNKDALWPKKAPM